MLEVLPDRRRVIIEAVNRVTRHEKVRTNRRGTQEGGIAHKEASIHASNVALICPTDGPARIGFQLEEGGGKVRSARSVGRSSRWLR